MNAREDEHAKQEAEANAFAFALLMPEELVRQEIRRMKTFDICNDKQITALARKFRVPDSIMAMRIGQLMKP